MSFQQLLEHSRRYGSDPAFVLLGGGNTSFKDGRTLFVKASGHALGTIGKEGFVRMDLDLLDQIWHKQYSQDDEERENEVLKDMMFCRLEGETARPSVEALLHALLPFPYVVHLHPALVNGLTCAQEGEASVHRLFPEALWVELVKPGFILANIVRERLVEHQAKTGKLYSLIFLQNHGIFVGGQSLGEIEQVYAKVLGTIEAQLVRKPDFTDLGADEEKVGQVMDVLQAFGKEKVLFRNTLEFKRILADRSSFAKVSSSFTPDHIVYAGFKPLWIDEGADVSKAFVQFEREHGSAPKIVCVQNLGVFSLGEKPLPLFFDSVAISVYSESFGGPRFMDEAMINFIRNWEVEKYRSQVSTS